MSADTLRKAAALMRGRATEVVHDSGVTTAASIPWFDLTDDTYGLGDPVHRYLASIPPVVALAVADWLDAEATWEERRANLVGARVQALAVARAYLGDDA